MEQLIVKTYPEKWIRFIPLPGWLAWAILWQILFFVDYLLSWQVNDTSAHSDVFAGITLFFASICIAVTYCCHVLTELFPQLNRFIELPETELREWYSRKLKLSYEGMWPLIAGVLMSVAAMLSVNDLIQNLTPNIPNLYYFRMAYLTIGFFLLGISFWALIQITLLPMEITKMKVKVSINQFAGNGLQALGGAYLKMSFAITISFIIIVVTSILAPFENNIIVLAWLGLAAMMIFGFFLVPQVGIHRVMATEKTNRMASFTQHLEEAMDKTLKDPSAENMQRLKELFEVQNHLKAMNEWPFDLNSIWQLLTALIIPIILALAEILFKS